MATDTPSADHLTTDNGERRGYSNSPVASGSSCGKIAGIHPNKASWLPWLTEAVVELEDLVSLPCWREILLQWLDIEHHLAYPTDKVCMSLLEYGWAGADTFCRERTSFRTRTVQERLEIGSSMATANGIKCHTSKVLTLRGILESGGIGGRVCSPHFVGQIPCPCQGLHQDLLSGSI